MMGIFAEAWQVAQGRTGSQMKTGDQAIKELLDATQKGQVISAKILPLVEEIARRESAGGVLKLRESSTAAYNRFWNKMSKGWQRFTEGGGEKGIKAFLDDLTESVGGWWVKNGAALGKQFEDMVDYFSLLRKGVTEFTQFMWTGKANSFQSWAYEDLGIDLREVRKFFIEMGTLIKDLTIGIAKAVGLIDENGNLDFAEFGRRVKNFTTKIGEVFGHLKDMLYYIMYAVENFAKIAEGGVWGIIQTQNPFSDYNTYLSDGFANLGAAGMSFARATGSGLGAITAPMKASIETPTKSAIPDYALNKMVVGDGKSGMSLRQHKLLNPELYNWQGGTNPESVGTSPIFQNGRVDFNINLKVEGDPESIKAFNAEAVGEKIYDIVPSLVEQGMNQQFNLKLKSSLTGAGNY